MYVYIYIYITIIIIIITITIMIIISPAQDRVGARLTTRGNAKVF